MEINAAIQALPAAGGEIVILDGTYIISDQILLNKDNCSISGSNATILKRNWEKYLYITSIIKIDADCCYIGNFYFDGNKDIFTYNGGNCCILVGGSKGSNNIISNCIFFNSGMGIRFHYKQYNSSFGNIFINNTKGIELYGADCVSVCGNIFHDNEDGIFSDY